MSAMASQIIGDSIVSSTICSGADLGKYQRSASLACVRGIRGDRKIFPFDDNIEQTNNVCFTYRIHKYLKAKWFKMCTIMDYKATFS